MLIDGQKSQYKVWGTIFIVLAVLELITYFLVPYANAEIIVAPINVTETSITWQWDESANVSSISINGLLIENFDNKSNSYQWSCAPYGCHGTINVYSDNDRGNNTTSTLPIIPTSSENFWNWVMSYILVIASIACAIISLKINVIGWIGVIFGLLGILTQLTEGSVIMTIIYLAAICANAYSGYYGSGSD